MAKRAHTFRLKKDKMYRENVMRIEASEREIKRKKARAAKGCRKLLKKIDRLQTRFESYWLWKWCCPMEYTGFRLVTKVEIEYSCRDVYVYFEGGRSCHVCSPAGAWPVKSDLEVLGEVRYNEKGNILPKMQAQNC